MLARTPSTSRLFAHGFAIVAQTALRTGRRLTRALAKKRRSHLPDPELKEWISLIKDALLGLAAIVTMIVGVYGVRAWKRDLVGKEVYSATRNLVKESHLVVKAASNLRQPIYPYEKRSFTEEEIQHTTKNERWRLSEVDAYKVKVEKFAKEVKRYDAAKLELRVLAGSKTYEAFLPLGGFLNETIGRVNAYLDLLQDHSRTLFPDSSDIIEVLQALYPSENLDDELSQKLADSREEGEKALLKLLHRKSIYG